MLPIKPFNVGGIAIRLGLFNRAPASWTGFSERRASHLILKETPQ